MKEKILIFLKKNRLVFLGIGLGMLGGYGYYFFIGCDTGTCPITANPYISSLYGAIIGGLIFESINRKK